jgi:myo-inositol-1(or 4)-monophosphatase
MPMPMSSIRRERVPSILEIMEQPYPADLLNIARTIAQEAGALALRTRREGVEIAATKSTDTDIVTYADQAVQDFVRARIAELRPNDGFFGEEDGGSRGTSGLTWVVDPIDGTVNYLYDIPHWAVSIAVVQGDPDPSTWTALAGAVINPSIGELFTAAAGGGAFLGEKQLRVAQQPDLGHALVATGFAYSAEKRGRQARVLTELLPRVRDIRRAGVCSLDLCAVAAGRNDAYFEHGVKPWDHAAGALIAREAGAQVGGYRGGAEGEELTLAANPTLFIALEELLNANRIE